MFVKKQKKNKKRYTLVIEKKLTIANKTRVKKNKMNEKKVPKKDF